jgi:hypothetical protein
MLSNFGFLKLTLLVILTTIVLVELIRWFIYKKKKE